MSHEVESLVYLGATPWHSLGTKVTDGFMPVEDFMNAAGMNWEVGLDSVYMSDGRVIPGSKATYRKSDGTILDVVGDRYTVLQNVDAFKWFEPFIESKEIAWETAGSLKGGRTIFVQAKIQTDPIEILKNDPVESYVLLSHGHTGKQAVRAGLTVQRVVCNNTLNISHNKASSKLIKMKHTSQIKFNLEKVREIMDIAKNEFIATTDQYKFLASKAISKKDLEKYVKIVFRAETEDGDERNIKRTLEKIEWVHENGLGSKSPNTMFKLYNSVNEYLNYHAGREQGNRLQSLWFGGNAELDRYALQVATDLALNNI